MADTVQRLLEDMVPELEDLQQHNLFSPTEIQQLVQQRQAHEYKLRRKNVSKLEFLRYIQYELNVTALIERRKQRSGMPPTRKLLSDYAGMRRLSFLYERALRKFNHDVPLWKQYLEYSRRIGSHHAIGKILPRAIQLNLKEESLWILHATWELEYGNNVEGGRAVLQRALRLNENSRSLWLAFVKMEVRFVVRMLERKRALGLISSGSPKEEDKQVGEFDLRFKGGEKPSAAEHAADSEAAQAEALAAKQHHALTTLLIPRAIYKNAISTKGLRADMDFRLEFLKALPSAYSAAMSVLEGGGEEGEEEDGTNGIPPTDPSRLSLSRYAYNHNPEDTLLTNFLRFNGKTNRQVREEHEREREQGEDVEMTDASAAPTADVPLASRHLYHVRFLPLLSEIFGSIVRDFPEEIHALRLQAEWRYIAGKVARECGEEAELEEIQIAEDQESAEKSQQKGATPEQRAFSVFETALTPSHLSSRSSACASYYAAHKTELDVDASAAGKERRKRLTGGEGVVWQVYIALAATLLRAEPANLSLRSHLSSLYTRAEKAGVRSEEIVRGQVKFLCEVGRAQEGVEILRDALLGGAEGKEEHRGRVQLWMALFDLEEKILACGGSLQDAEEHHDQEGAATSKKRKKATSTAASSTTDSSSPLVTPSLLLSHFNAAISSVPADDKILVWERLLAFVQTQCDLASGSAELRSAYITVHTTFHRLLTCIPRPPGCERMKERYLEWLARVTGRPEWEEMRSGGRKEQQGASSSKHPHKKQKLADTSSDDEDGDVASIAAASSVPSYVPSLSLNATEAIRSLTDTLLGTPPVSFEFLQTAINLESTLAPIPTNTNSSNTNTHVRRMKELYERCVLAYGATSPTLWFSYLSWTRSTVASSAASPSSAAAAASSSFTAVQAAGAANQIHFRATKELRPEYQAEWAELQTALVQ